MSISYLLDLCLAFLPKNNLVQNFVLPLSAVSSRSKFQRGSLSTFECGPNELYVWNISPFFQSVSGIAYLSSLCTKNSPLTSIHRQALLSLD